MHSRGSCLCARFLDTYLDKKFIMLKKKKNVERVVQIVTANKTLLNIKHSRKCNYV